MMNDLPRALRVFIRDNFLFGQKMDLPDDASFLDRGIIDSTGVLELVAFIENRCCLQVADEELVPENLDSIDNIVKYVASKQAGEAVAT